MEDVGKILLNYVAPIGITIIAIYHVVSFLNDLESVKKIIIKIKKGLSAIIHFFNTLKRRRYDKVLASKDYLDFQLKVLSVLYADELKKLCNDNIKQTILFDKQFESVDIRFKEPIEFPFTNVIDRENGCEYEFDEKIKLNYSQKKYKKLIKRTIRKPKKIGYMLKNIDFENEKIQCYCGTYEQNLYTSHYLEYELYLLYKKKNRFHVDELIEENNAKNLLKLLPYRNKIHMLNKRNGELLLSGDGRYSLLGVQAMILLKKPNNSYDVLRIRRGENVAAKPGFLQFIPSGGFEVFENKTDFDTKYANFSLSKAIFRELMEECFNVDEEPSNEHISSERIYAYNQINKLMELIECGKAEFKLLGSSLSLVSLRHELSFMIKIDDVEFAKNISCNYESDGVISSIDINTINNIKFWNCFSKNNDFSDLEKLNCTSASLLNLVNETVK